MAFTINQSGLTGSQFGLGVTPARPASSARAILAENPNAPSGWYWISFPGVLGNYPLETYCDMTGSSAGSTVGGWMRLDLAWWESHRALAQYQLTPNGTPAYSGGNGLGMWMNGYWGEYGATNLGRYWQESATDGVLRTLQFRLPSGSRGIRVTKLRMYSVGGSDWPSWNDTTATNPSNSQIVSSGSGSTVSLGSNYTCFGIYFGNGSGSGVRPYRTSNGDYPTNAEAPYGGYVTLTQNSFVPYGDTGIDSDRLIFFQTDGNTEYEYLYDWTFWVR